MSTMHKMPEPIVEEVADGVFAYIQPDGSWFLNNTGIVVGPDSVVMVDQTGTEDRGRSLLGTVRRVGGGKSIQALVNTHHHGDHTFGNYLVPAGTSIIGHHRCRLETQLTGTAITALFQGPEQLLLRVGDRPRHQDHVQVRVALIDLLTERIAVTILIQLHVDERDIEALFVEQLQDEHSGQDLGATAELETCIRTDVVGLSIRGIDMRASAASDPQRLTRD